MKYTRLYLAAAACSLLFVLSGCDASVSTEADAVGVPAQFARPGTAGADGIAAAQRATARYHDVDAALADGWVADDHCVEFPPLGGMGYHYLNPGRLDGVVEAAAPEVILYEPQRNGRLRLVAVEYIVPFGGEPRAADGGTPPELFGQTFSESEPAGGWALHVWIWRHNPAGIFADFNPDVSCENA